MNVNFPPRFGAQKEDALTRLRRANQDMLRRDSELAAEMEQTVPGPGYVVEEVVEEADTLTPEQRSRLRQANKDMMDRDPELAAELRTRFPQNFGPTSNMMSTPDDDMVLEGRQPQKKD